MNHTAIVRPEPSCDTVVRAVLEHVQDALKIERADAPVNEFERNGRQIMQTFWYHFPLQRGLTQFKGTIPISRTRHMLQHCSGRFARDSDFILFLGNQHQRHKALAATKRAATVHNHRFQDFEDIANLPDIEARLEAAVDNPDARESRDLLRRLLPMVSAPATAVPWSSTERASCIGMMLAMARRYGPPSCFLTVAPDDVHDPTCIRLALTHHSNESFPAVADGFMEALQGGRQQFAYAGGSLSLKEDDLQALAAKCPGATAMAYQNLIETVLATLYGIPTRAHTRKSKAPSEHAAGFLGTPVGYFGVTEVSGRCAEHLHIVFFGGATPDALSGCIDDEALLRKVISSLDSMYQAKLPIGIVAADRARRAVGIPSRRAAYHAPPPVLDDSGEQLSSDFVRDACLTVVAVQMHRHTPKGACGKKPQGEKGCRFHMYAAHPVRTTRALLVSSCGANEEGEGHWELPDPRLPIDDFFCRSPDCDHNAGVLDLLVQPLPLRPFDSPAAAAAGQTTADIGVHQAASASADGNAEDADIAAACAVITDITMEEAPLERDASPVDVTATVSNSIASS